MDLYPHRHNRCGYIDRDQTSAALERAKRAAVETVPLWEDQHGPAQIQQATHADERGAHTALLRQRERETQASDGTFCRPGKRGCVRRGADAQPKMAGEGHPDGRILAAISRDRKSVV